MPKSASSPISKRFDYDSLDSTDAVFVQQQTGAIQSLMKRSAQDIVDIGQRLTEVKKRLGHGRFGAWLEAEFDWSQDTATNFMRVAQRFGDNPKISEFAPSALYLLAAPSTPRRAKEEALSRAEAGESISYKAARDIKQKYTPPKKASYTPATQVPPEAPSVQPDNLQGQASHSSQAVPQSDATAQVDAAQSEIALLQPPEVRDTPSPPLSTSAIPPSGITSPPATPVSTSAPPLQQAQSPSHPASPRQRAADPAQPQLEILAIRPREAAIAEPAEEANGGETVTPAERHKARFVQPGSWWQFGEEHLLYYGDPISPRFRERLPERVALSLAFPPMVNSDEWKLGSLSADLRSSLALYTRYQSDQEIQLFREMIERSLLLYTEGGDAVVFSYLPDPEILMLAHKLECRWFCAEPDPVKCEAAIVAWKAKGLRAEKVTGLRF